MRVNDLSIGIDRYLKLFPFRIFNYGKVVETFLFSCGNRFQGEFLFKLGYF